MKILAKCWQGKHNSNMDNTNFPIEDMVVENEFTLVTSKSQIYKLKKHKKTVSRS